jgi:hypothetical protein
MIKRGFNSLTWKVKRHDCNSDKICDYDVLKYREDFIKKLKKQCGTKEEFAEKMRREMMWMYWSRAEWELIIEIDENDRVWLSPWVGSRNPNEVKIDVTDVADFDWHSFAEDHILHKGYRDGTAKIDVFDQLEARWDEFIDYCWYTRLKYERDDPKFHR